MKKLVCLMIAAQLAMFSPHRAEARTQPATVAAIVGGSIAALMLGSMFFGGGSGGACCGGGPMISGGAMIGGGPVGPNYGYGYGPGPGYGYADGGAAYGYSPGYFRPGYAYDDGMALPPPRPIPGYMQGAPAIVPPTNFGAGAPGAYATGFGQCFNQFQCGVNNNFPIMMQNRRHFVHIVPGRAGMLMGRPGLPCREFTEVVSLNGAPVSQNRGVACYNRRTGRWQPVPQQFAMQFVPQYNNWRAAPPATLLRPGMMGSGYAQGQGYMNPTFGSYPRPIGPMGPPTQPYRVGGGAPMVAGPVQTQAPVSTFRPNLPATLPAQPRPGYPVGGGIPAQQPGYGYGAKCGQYNAASCPGVLPAMR